MPDIRVRRFLYCCLIFSLFLPYFSSEAGAVLPGTAPGGLGACPYSTSVLDRQVNQTDTLLLTGKNRDNSTFPCNDVTDRIDSRNIAKRYTPSANSIITGKTPFSRTCLWYTPLLPIPPPHS